MISILGGGSWGLALADLLNRNGQKVVLWEFKKEDYDELVSTRTLPNRLTDFELDDNIEITNDLTEAVADTEVIILATPAQFLRNVLKKINYHHRQAALVNVAKGIETGTLKRMSEIVRELWGIPAHRIATLSGPSHAEEVIKQKPTAVVAASESILLTEQCQELFSSDSFRVYISDDLTGVELGGSLKNVIAIATGIIDGLKLGDNTLGALITRGLAEITRLGVAMGAKAETFAGLSGIGDLVTTCCSKHSRNRQVGYRIGRGEKLPDILKNMVMVAEGVETTRSALALSKLHNIEMPITSEVHKVLFDGKSPLEAASDLMGRELKAEIW